MIERKSQPSHSTQHWAQVHSNIACIHKFGSLHRISQLFLQELECVGLICKGFSFQHCWYCHEHQYSSWKEDQAKRDELGSSNLGHDLLNNSPKTDWSRNNKLNTAFVCLLKQYLHVL